MVLNHSGTVYNFSLRSKSTRFHPLAQADLWLEEAALRRECVSSSTLPPRPHPLPLVGPFSSQGWGHRTDPQILLNWGFSLCLTAGASGMERMLVMHRAPGTSSLYHP